MEKSLAHWKAAHPLIYISISLCIGYMGGNYTGPFNKVMSHALAIFILTITLGLLFILRQLKIKNWLQGCVIMVILMSWGMVIYLTTHSQNLIRIPYPIQWINEARLWIIQKIDTAILNKEANGFAKALLIGAKTNMDKNLMKAYTQLGIVHIIAISGMHLDILFKNLLRITNWLPRKKIWLLIELIFILLAVWGYTFIAYGSPSVIRASLFFSIYFIGTFLSQAKYNLNCIAGGILVVLFFDGQSIFHIGLQLSYAAVIGIHLFYPLFFKMVPMDNPILNWMWRNLCMTLSAQITTLPILLYHFHQTSTLVIISNFFMVPLSTVLLYALIILVIMPNQINLIQTIGGWIQSYIKFLNNGVLYFNHNPISSPFLIQMSGKMVILYYVIVFLIYAWLYKMQAKYLLYAFAIFTFIYLIKLFH